MYIVDSHCDSIQLVDKGKFPLVNPHNFSSMYNQLQFVAMFCICFFIYGCSEVDQNQKLEDVELNLIISVSETKEDAIKALDEYKSFENVKRTFEISR